MKPVRWWEWNGNEMEGIRVAGDGGAWFSSVSARIGIVSLASVSLIEASTACALVSTISFSNVVA